MTNAVFDLSNMFFRSLFIVGGFGAHKLTFDKEEETDRLMRKIAMDITSIIRQLNPSRAIITLDSKSWRKNISIDENEGYKGQRKKAEGINWDNVFKVMNEFAEILEMNGFIVSQVKDAEADDLMALWRDEIVYNMKEHAILISGDEDIRQLASKNDFISASGKNKTAYGVIYNPFTMGKNPSRKLFVPDTFESWLKDDVDLGDIFNRGIDVDKQDFERILNMEKTKMETLNGSEIAKRKIFCGDDGDNVPAIYTWLTKTAKGEEKSVRITPAKYEKIMKAVNYPTLEDLMASDELYDQILAEIKAISKDEPTIDIRERFDRQFKLVVLNRKVFPEKIVSDFEKTIQSAMDIKPINPQSCNMTSILEGTRYVDATGKYKSKGGEISIFKEIDKIKSKELF